MDFSTIIIACGVTRLARASVAAVIPGCELSSVNATYCVNVRPIDLSAVFLPQQRLLSLLEEFAEALIGAGRIALMRHAFHGNTVRNPAAPPNSVTSVPKWTSSP